MPLPETNSVIPGASEPSIATFVPMPDADYRRGIDDELRDPFKERGTAGLKASGGYVIDDPLAALQGLKGIKVWREMSDSDPIVGSLLFIIKQQIRKIELQVEAAELPEGHPKAMLAEQAVEWVEGVLDDMETPITDVKAEASTMLEYGFAPMEVTFKWRHGYTPSEEGAATSKHDDGLLGVHKIALRAQDTIARWDMTSKGIVKGFWQQPHFGPEVYIPIQKVALFRTTKVKDNPEGRSILRNAYRPWMLKKTFERIETIGVERDIAGLPVARLPMSLIKAAQEGDGTAKAVYEAYRKLVTNIRRDEKEGAILPSDKDQQGNYLYDLTLLASPSRRATDVSGPITRYSQEIAQTVLVDFILLGHGARGTQALATTKVDIFLDSIQGYMDNIAATFTTQVLKPLWELNGFDPEIMPRITADNTKQVDPERLASLLSQLTSAGMPIFPDPQAEAWVRARVGLPEPSPEAMAMREQQNIIAQQQADNIIMNGGVDPNQDMMGHNGGPPMDEGAGHEPTEEIGSSGDKSARFGGQKQPGQRPAGFQPRSLRDYIQAR